MRTKLIILTILIQLLLLGKSIAQMPDSVKTYIDSALYIMESKSLFAKKVNWDKIRDSTYQLAKHAINIEESFIAIKYAFEQLNDSHGMLASQNAFHRIPPPINFSEVLSPGIKSEFLKGNRFVHQFLPDNIAYLRVPTMPVTEQTDIDELGNRLRDLLCELLAENPSGLILDLRMNSGGNSAPMLSGLGPIFHKEVIGYGVDKDGILLHEIKLTDGVVIGENGEKMVNIQNSCMASQEIPIAVLIGPSTASSGEILAYLLQTQSNVMTFGEPSPGFCNATQGFIFMEQKGYLLLTVQRIADANQSINVDMKVIPDVFIKSDDNYENLLEDVTINPAIDWINKSKSIHFLK
jgi:carboxyl-terminal processing protease